MIPVVPQLSARPLRQNDHGAAAAMIARVMETAPFSRPMDVSHFEQEVSTAEPPTVYPARWQRHLQIGAWRAGELVGFLDLASGHDSDSSELPDYEPVGLVRFLALPEREDLIQDVSQLLFQRVVQFWKAAGVGYVKAFHISTGYPSFQSGAGVLPGDWGEHVRMLTNAGFQFISRYYLLQRSLQSPMEESVPASELSIAFRGPQHDRVYDIYYRRTEWVGRARCLLRRPNEREAFEPFAHLVDFTVAKDWRRRRIGGWLVRRVINDATLSGVPTMAAFVSHEHAAAQNLLAELGFLEQNYRGYTLEQSLSE